MKMVGSMEDKNKIDVVHDFLDLVNMNSRLGRNLQNEIFTRDQLPRRLDEM